MPEALANEIPNVLFRPASLPRFLLQAAVADLTRRRETRLRRALTPLVLLAVRGSPDSGSSQLRRASIGKNNEISIEKEISILAPIDGGATSVRLNVSSETGVPARLHECE